MTSFRDLAFDIAEINNMMESSQDLLVKEKPIINILDGNHWNEQLWSQLKFPYKASTDTFKYILLSFSAR